jgi:hypothetical protein
VADADTVVDVRQLLRHRPVARNVHDAARFVVGLGYIVVDHEHDLRLVPQRRAELFEHRLQAPRTARIMKHGEIHVAGDDFPDFHFRPPAGRRNQFLCKRLCYWH